jgi:hypothetical protein
MIYEKYLCYLTEEANRARLMLIDLGLEPDLALAVLEQLWAEDEIYELPEA